MSHAFLIRSNEFYLCDTNQCFLCRCLICKRMCLLKVCLLSLLFCKRSSQFVRATSCLEHCFAVPSSFHLRNRSGVTWQAQLLHEVMNGWTKSMTQYDIHWNHLEPLDERWWKCFMKSAGRCTDYIHTLHISPRISYLLAKYVLICHDLPYIWFWLEPLHSATFLVRHVVMYPSYESFGHWSFALLASLYLVQFGQFVSVSSSQKQTN